MASISYVSNNVNYPRRNSSDTLVWGDWTYSSGGTIQNPGFIQAARYKLDYTGAVKLKAVSVSPGFNTVGGDASYAASITCYLYTSDPTTGTYTGQVPYGYVASATVSHTVTASTTYATFSFSGLSVLSASYIYFVFAINTSGKAAAVQLGPQYNYGSISGTFQLQPVTMSLSSYTVTTGSNQVLTFANGNGRTVSVVIKQGSTQLYAGTTTTGSLTIPVTKIWFSTAGITTYRDMNVSVQATETDSGTLSASFTVSAGSDMAPTVGMPAVSIVQKEGKPTTNFPTTYLANISKAKVQVQVASGSNASIASVVLTYTGGSAIEMTYNGSSGKYEATTPELTNSSTTFTVTVRDGRKYNLSGSDIGGMSAAKTSSAVTVVPYIPPSLNINASDTYRCLQDGTEDAGGAYFKAKATASWYSALSGNSIENFFVYVQGRYDVYDLTSGVQTPNPLDGTLTATTNYTLVFALEDSVSDAVTKTFALGSQVRDIVFKHNNYGTTLGVGMTPQRASGSSVELPPDGDFLLGGIPAHGFPVDFVGSDWTGGSFQKDFLNVNTSDGRAPENAATHFYVSTAQANIWSNAPSAMSGQEWLGYRMVFLLGSTMYGVVILEFKPTAGRIWVNYYYGTTWSGWRYLTSTAA